MTNQKLIFGIGGLLIGAVIGFMLANKLNQAGPQTPAAGPITPANSALPPDHPALTQNGGSGVPEVMAAIEKAKQQPNDVEAQLAAGDLYYRIQRFADAAKFYEAAARLAPDNAAAAAKAGNALFDGEQYPRAAEWYEKALKLKPRDISVQTDLGLTYLLRQPPDYDRAIAYFQESLGIDPRHELTLQNLAVAYTQKGDKENAEKTIAKLREVNPQNAFINKGTANAAP